MLELRTYALLAATVGAVALTGCGGGGGGSGSGSTAAGIGSALVMPGPKVEIVGPGSGTHVPGQTALVEGVVTDEGQGVLRVAVNGVEVATQAGPFQTQVPLEPGVNTFSVEAWDTAGGHTERHVSVLAGDLAPASAAIGDGAQVALAGAAAPLLSSFQTTSTSGGGATGYPNMTFTAAYSGNYTVRPSRTIDRVVIHTIEGSATGAISWFRNPASNVSAHYVVSHGGQVTQMVREKDRAWHCGNWNERAIGIENEGYAGRNDWTDTQYRVLAQLTRAICDRYNIPIDRTHLVGHVEVPGATHTDPGRYFDWARFMALVRNGGTTTTTRPRPSTQVLTTATGKELEVAWSPKAPQAASGVTRVELDVNITARQPIAGRLDRSVVISTARADVPAPAGGRNVGLAVHMDALNRGLHAAWRAGALDTRVTPSSLVTLAPLTTGTLDGAAIVASNHVLSSLIPPDSKLELELEPGLPPVVTVLQQGELEVALGALSVKIDAVDAAGVATPLGRVTVALRAPVWIDGVRGASRFVLSGASKLQVDVEPGLRPEEEARLRRLAEALETPLRDAALGALEGAILPAPGGLDLRGLTFGSSRRTLLVSGTQR
jgi:N-acetyl-anhydromuramyl-L-alanine amidase AmpD